MDPVHIIWMEINSLLVGIYPMESCWLRVKITSLSSTRTIITIKLIVNDGDLNSEPSFVKITIINIGNVPISYFNENNEFTLDDHSSSHCRKSLTCGRFYWQKHISIFIILLFLAYPKLQATSCYLAAVRRNWFLHRLTLG
jgi:hypothetical protein